MEALEERLIETWIELTSLIKNNRITKTISYNEAVVLNLVYKAYLKNEGIYIQEILRITKMLKSLCNRTLNELISKGFIIKKMVKNQGLLFFNSLKEKDYLKIHQETLNYIAPIIKVFGQEDTEEFIRIVSKITKKEVCL